MKDRAWLDQIGVDFKKEVIDTFSKWFEYIDEDRSRDWRAWAEDGFLFVQCYNGTKNYIEPESCKHVLDEINKNSSWSILYEERRYCIEDDEKQTKIVWKISLIEKE